MGEPEFHYSIRPFASALAILQIAVTGDIARPNEPVNQYPPRDLRVRGGAHDARHPDATAEKRRPRRGFRRRRDRKYLRRPDHQRAYKDHGLARRDFLPAHFCSIDSLRPQGEYAEQPDPKDRSGVNARARRLRHACAGHFSLAELGCDWNRDSQSGAISGGFNRAGNYSRYFDEAERGTFRFRFSETVAL